MIFGQSISDNCFSGLRIEWCKSRARALRWSEEVKLLQEEMRRVLAFLEWRAGWWAARGLSMAAACSMKPTPYIEGLLAYSARQANIQRALANRFTDMWSIVPRILENSDVLEDNVETRSDGED
jgi:hypothetical protein